eukprot:216132-Chlamydomonas_euryale.AAC.2
MEHERITSGACSHTCGKPGKGAHGLATRMEKRSPAARGGGGERGGGNSKRTVPGMRVAADEGWLRGRELNPKP